MARNNKGKKPSLNNRGAKNNYNARKKGAVAKNDIVNLLKLGYRDYIAARYLLIHDFLFQGIILSSTAVEKYLKAVIALRTGSISRVHLDKFSIFYSEAQNSGIDFSSNFDSKYLQLLSLAYKFRYYDALKGTDCIGFLKWQVVGELDFTVNFLDCKASKILNIESDYSRFAKSQDEHLFEENYILNEWDKKSFMERPSKPFFLGILDGGEELAMEGGEISCKYQGKINTVESFEVRGGS